MRDAGAGVFARRGWENAESDRIGASGNHGKIEKQNRGKDGSLPENYENSKAFLAQKQITVQSMAEKDIRDKVLHAAEKLYAENIYTIEQDRKMHRLTVYGP